MLRVNVANGETIYRAMDLYLPGYIPFQLFRTYCSNRGEAGLPGYGWKLNVNISLSIADTLLVFRDEEDRQFSFPFLGVGAREKSRNGNRILLNQAEAFVVICPGGRQYIFAKQAAINKVMPVSHIEIPGPHQLQFHYERGRLLGVEDTLNRRIAFGYQQERLSRVQVTATDTPHNPVAIVSYRYSPGGDLVATLDAGGGRTLFEYHDHLLVSVTAPGGGRTFAQYDQQRRCVACWREDGWKQRVFQYDDLRMYTRMIDANGFQRLYRCSDRRLVLEEITPAGETRRYYYGKDLSPGGAANLRGDLEIFHAPDEDARQLIRIKNGEDVLANHYGENQQLQVQEDSLGQQTRLDYDDAGRITGLLTPLKALWQFRRDARGIIAEIASPENRRLGVTVGEDGRDWILRDELGMLLKLKLDLFGRVMEESGAPGRWQRFRYDPAGKPLEILSDDNHFIRIAWDSAGNPLSLTDAPGSQWSREYDRFGRLTAETPPDGNRRQYTYDREGQVLAVAGSNGSKIELARDSLGRILRYHATGKPLRRYRYRDGGFAVTILTEKGEINLAYNAAGRLLSAAGSDGSWRRFEYNAAGLLLAAYSPSSSVTFEYDEEGRLSSEVQDDQRLDFDYDKDGNLIALEIEGLRKSRRVYDQRNRLSGLLDERQGEYRFAYEALNRLCEIHFPCGLREERQYDRRDHLQRQQWSLADSRLLREIVYEYDPAGRLITWRDSRQGRSLFSYDDSGRVTQVQHESGLTESYRYDRQGKLLSSPFSQRYEYHQDGRLLQSDEARYQYDEGGYLSEKLSAAGTARYRYNLLGELIHYTAENGSAYQFRYDAFGRRVVKSENAGETCWLWHGPLLLAESGPSGVSGYLYWGNLPLGFDNGGEGRAFLSGHAGQILGLAGGDGEMIWKPAARYASGWYEFANDASPGPAVRYPGHFFDSDTGFHHTHFGDYDPRLGVFFRPEPVPLPAGFHPLQPLDPRSVFTGVNRRSVVAWPSGTFSGRLLASWLSGTQQERLWPEYHLPSEREAIHLYPRRKRLSGVGRLVELPELPNFEYLSGPMGISDDDWEMRRIFQNLWVP